MSNYIGVEPITESSRVLTEGTLLSDTDTISLPLGYTPLNIAVFLNGIKLSKDEYTAENGFDIVFSSVQTSGTEYIVEEYRSFNPANTLAEDVRYDNTTSGLTATNLNSAVDELETEKAPLESPAFTTSATLDGVDLATETFVENLSLGVNQAWQDVTGSRALGVTYTNTTGKTIFISVGTHTAAGIYQLTITANIDGVNIKIGQGSNTSGNTSAGGCIAVPDGANYSLSSGYTLTYWYELR